jgi:hypothetical protein
MLQAEVRSHKEERKRLGFCFLNRLCRRVGTAALGARTSLRSSFEGYSRRNASQAGMPDQMNRFVSEIFKLLSTQRQAGRDACALRGLLLAYASHLRDVYAKQHHRGLTVVYGNGLDRRQMRKARKKASHSPVALAGINYVFVDAEGDRAAPVVLVRDFVNLETGSRVRAKRLELAARQRVNVDVLAVKNVVDRDNVRSLFVDDSQPADRAFGKKRPSLFLAQWCDHAFTLCVRARERFLLSTSRVTRQLAKPSRAKAS